jgi:hypothetical protein
MTSREELIEEAAKAIYSAHNDALSMGRARMIASGVLAVFERAHTPTDDEWEARDLAWIDWDAARYSAPVAFGGKRLSAATLGDAFYAGWDARARRTVQGEST